MAEQIPAHYAAPFFNASAFFNLSSSILPSPADLFWAVPRLAQRAGSFALFDIPEHLDLFISKAMRPGNLISGSTASVVTSNASITPSATSSISSMPLPSAAPTQFSDMSFTSFVQNWGLYKISNIDGIFSYMISRWAVSTVVIAVILNRAQVYASSRRRLRLNLHTRIFVRIVPILSFLFQIRKILETMQCQTGPYQLQIHVPATNDIFRGAFTNEGGFLYKLSSALLFWQDHETSCLRSRMIPAGDDHLAFVGSSAVLWPLFLDLCISHFVEVLSSSLQGRQPMAETGMTIFEHSLAFAEAEAVVRGSVGLGFFNVPRAPSKSSNTAASTTTTTAKGAPPTGQLSRPMLLTRLNVPPEVLLIGLISCCSHLSSHLLGVVGLQSKFRLVNTGIWATCFMTAFMWSFIKFSRYPAEDDGGVLRYPTVCIIGFIPHMLIIAGIVVCGVIYCLAVFITALSPPTEDHARETFLTRLKQAKNNLQASASLSQIKLSWHEEFYTTLLKVGFTILTSASEAVYFNEGTNVAVTERTWLEEKRLGQFAQARASKKILSVKIPPVLQGDAGIADGVGLVDEETHMYLDGKSYVSGFARERKATSHDSTASTAATREEGVGGAQRTGRWLLSGRFLRSVFTLLKTSLARTIYLVLYRFRATSPNWLREAAGYGKKDMHVNSGASNDYEAGTLDFWYLTDDGSLTLPDNTMVDVEHETRKRLAMKDKHIDYSERAIEKNLYKWWKTGGWWGELDGSGDYEPSVRTIDEDLTSVISESSEISSSDLSSLHTTDFESDGRQTPTQDNPNPAFSRGITPASDTEADTTLSHLAQMLDPKTLEDKQDARLLALRLRSKSGPMTRSQYRKTRQTEQARILAPSYNPSSDRSPTDRLTAEEEEDLLEQIILSRRQESRNRQGRTSSYNQSTSHVSTGSWATGADGMGNDGPQCVVCHSSPRTILVWPCRCLSLCEECRVSLAMNNFGSCVCCRRDVVAFSRLYVP